MTTARHAIRPKAALEPVRRAAPPAATPAATPRYLKPSLKLGGLNDPQEHEAEHAAGIVAGGGSYEVRDPGGSMHLRAAAAPLLDPGATGRVRRAVAAPILDPGASGRISRATAPGGGVGHDTAQRIERARAATSRPLPPAVQSRLERGFGERMDKVRVHTGPAARAAAHGIGARAYTEGERITLGPGESEHDVRLMAHEATHVVQNRRAAGIVRPLVAEPAARRASPPVAHGEIRRAEALATPKIRRLPLGADTALDYFADQANAIPGFRLFTIVLGLNPINMAHVDASGANILRAAVEMIPFGALIVKALEQYGIFEKGGAFIDQQVASLGMTGAAIRAALVSFLDSLSAADIFHPGDVWDRAKRILTEPIDRLIAFFKAVGAGIIDLIKDAVLKPLAALASKTQAWDLLCAVLGSNPITGETVERTPETLIGGFMKLAGQQEVWERIKKTGALQRAWAWFQKTMTDLVGLVSRVPGLFLAALKSFEISDLLDLPGAIGRLSGMFTDFVVKFISWAGNAIWNLLEIVFDVVSPGALGYIKRTGTAIKSIFKNPLPFIGNLVKAAKLGLENFAGNFLTHLKAGLIDWLTGSLPGVYIPKAISLLEVGKFALSVLGISWAQIRAKIVKALGPSGEKIMQGLEVAFDVVKALVTGGPAAAWEVIKDKLTNLKDMVIDGIISFVTDTVIKKAIPKLVSLFIPGAGFISAIISIYDVVTGFVARLSTIAAAVKAFIDSIVAIAQGQIGGAAAKVESVLAGVLSLAIGLLASFLGLGNIASKVLALIGKVRAVVDKALDTAIAWVVGKAKALFAKLFGKKDGKKDDRTEEEKLRDLSAAVTDANALLSREQPSKAEAIKLLDPIKRRYRLTAIEIITDSQDGGQTKFHLNLTINPKLPSVGLVDASRLNLITAAPPFIFKSSPGRNTLAEFDRQIRLQESTMNAMFVSKWLSNRINFETGGRSAEGTKLQADTLEAEREAFRERAYAGRVSVYKSSNMSENDANIKATIFINKLLKRVKGDTNRSKYANASMVDDLGNVVENEMYRKVALHALDQVAGGEGTDVRGVGGASEDKSLGRQWRAFDRIGDIDRKVSQQVKQLGLKPDRLDKIKMCVSLPYVESK